MNKLFSMVLLFILIFTANNIQVFGSELRTYNFQNQKSIDDEGFD